MLIYVVRVVLEGDKWDDPFANWEHLHKEAVKVIDCLKATIEDTPHVLTYQTPTGSFVSRGNEPLWLWLFPKLLRLLGHPKCLNLSDFLESFFQSILEIACASGLQWDWARSFCYYLRDIYESIQRHLRTQTQNGLRLRDAIPISLPSIEIQKMMLGYQDCTTISLSSTTYKIATVSHALDHASGICKILSVFVESAACQTLSVPLWREPLLWLLESVSDFQELKEQMDHPPKICVFSTELLLSVMKSLEKAAEVDSHVRDKVCFHTLHSCARLIAGLLKNTSGPKPFKAIEVISLAFINLIRWYRNGKGLNIRPLFECQVETQLDVLPEDKFLATFNNDFKICHNLLRQVLELPEPAHFSSLMKPSNLSSTLLQDQLKQLNLPYEKPHFEPETKRRRISNPVADKKTLKLNTHFFNALGLEASNDLSLLKEKQQLILEQFTSMNDKQRVDLIYRLGILSCALDGEDWSNCSFCHRSRTRPIENPYPEVITMLSELFTELAQIDAFLESRRPRVAAMIVIRSIISHTRSPNVLDVEKSGLGRWCLFSLRSSIRELRVSASRTLTCFLSETPIIENKITQKNKENVLQVLRQLASDLSPRSAESCIMAWGQVGVVAVDNELELVLAQLVDFLSQENSIISSLALNEIVGIASRRGVPPHTLFEPFWKNLAFSVVKDMMTAPRKVELVTKILRIKMDDFLLTTQKFSLPWLFLSKRADVLSRITAARKETDAAAVFLAVENLSPILARLLVQEVPDKGTFVLEIIRSLSPHFESECKDVTIGDLMKMDSIRLCLELLLIAADGDNKTKNQVRNALTYLSTTLNPEYKNSKKQNVIGRHLQHLVLGLVNFATSVIQATFLPPPPVQDRVRNIKAIEEMIKLCKSYVRIGRPHIATCLLSCFAEPKLRSTAFSCWVSLVRYMEEEDVQALIETTFFIINHHWAAFDEESKREAIALIDFLIEQHPGLVKTMIGVLPKLKGSPGLDTIEATLQTIRQPLEPKAAFQLYSQRIQHENSGVVLLGLEELSEYLDEHQEFLQLSAIGQQPDEIVSMLMRSLLDCSSKYNTPDWSPITQICTQCLGKVGCLDSNRVETLRQDPEFVLISNFTDSSETTDFVIFLLENVIIKSFVSTSNTKVQQNLSYVMQELLIRCDFRAALQYPNMEGAEAVLDKWKTLSEFAKEILTPFLNSTYTAQKAGTMKIEYPLFKNISKPLKYHEWIRNLTWDLLGRPMNGHGHILFEPLQRLARIQDVSVAEFLLPYLFVHIVLAEPKPRLISEALLQELKDVLGYQPPVAASYAEMEDTKLCYHAVFRIVDYAMRWLQKRNSFLTQKLPPELSETVQCGGDHLTDMVYQIDKEKLSQRASDCNDFSRALFSLELYVQQMEDRHREEQERRNLAAGEAPNAYKIPTDVLKSMLDVYANIDDPDGLDGILTQFPTLDIDQQVMSHRKAGRWAAAQSWYEIKLAEEPHSVDRQLDLLVCLKESGQYDILLNHIEGMVTSSPESQSRLAPFALEAFWATGRWESLENFLVQIDTARRFEDFNCGVAEVFRRLRASNMVAFEDGLRLVRDQITASMTFSATASLRTCHSALLQCHVLTELELIAGANRYSDLDRQSIVSTLNRRLEILGAYVADKKFVLGVRRAAMGIMQSKFTSRDISSLWLTSAKLARKSGASAQAFSAVLHASQLGDGSSTLENARLLWADGHNRKAIQVLEGAIKSNALLVKDLPMEAMSVSKSAGSVSGNLITAKAHLLLAKWHDDSGQTHFAAQRSKYLLASKTYPTWEKPHYYLGRHYKKLLEAEIALKQEDQSEEYVTGQVTRLVIENYIRALGFGTKYLHQSLPRVLTLWLDFGASIETSQDGRQYAPALRAKRQSVLNTLHAFLDRYIRSKLPVFMWYTVIFQIVARIAHPNKEVFEKLEAIIIRVIQAYPRQALWSLFGLMTTRQQGDRRLRGNSVLQKLRADKSANETGLDMRSFIRMGEKLGDQLLQACHVGNFPNNKTTRASITRDLQFNHKCTPCPLVVPTETSLSATLPLVGEGSLRNHKPFSGDAVTIQGFSDEVLVLGSLAKPRRVTVRGSNGKKYYLMLKPSDDLRTDQRLMEFNGIVNRALKRDAESSKRQLYVKTYAVTPLNEECGIIEWVDGLKTLRDILLNLYRGRNVAPNYHLIQNQMKMAVAQDNMRIWTDEILGKFPPVLQQWFVAQFPSPSLWFSARLRYTRSCAVMSMLGTILGLGDRHGENVLLEEGNGGVFHVDFNCLFDKGRTFQCPERVPFRLTHNMVHAMGVQGYEGAFRSSSELTLSILRQQEETLMSILEAFIYDPTLDLQKDKKKKGGSVKLNPQSVVRAIKRKIHGHMGNETIPLGVEGQVEELIKEAVSHKNLASMYIGWCPFL